MVHPKTLLCQESGTVSLSSHPPWNLGSVPPCHKAPMLRSLKSGIASLLGTLVPSGMLVQALSHTSHALDRGQVTRLTGLDRACVSVGASP